MSKTLLLACAAAAACALHAAGARGERKIYAHYMGCAPAGHGAISYYRSKTAAGLRGDAATYQLDAYSLATGGYYVNWPLVPARTNLSAEANARLEIARARRFGIDGFAFDAWAGGAGAMQLLDVFFKVAEEMKVDFGLTICFDPSCHGGVAGATLLDKYAASAAFVLRHRASPNLARFDGKPLFFGYYSGALARAPQGAAPLVERLRREKEAWDAFRARVGTPVFIHGSLDAHALAKDVDWATVGAWAAQTYDAVGGFLGTDRGWGTNAALVASVKAGGAIWSQPMFYQYDNKSGGVLTRPGLSWLRENWRAALANDARLLQFVTWNDYGEETILAPSTGGAYTVPRINRHYADWWRNGVEPKVEKDEIHAVYRRTVGDAEPFPLQARRLDGLASCLEITTFLTAPATVHAEGYGAYEAPAGVFVKEFPLKPGPVAVAARRRGEDGTERTACGFRAPEEVSAKRWREDFTLVAYGSNFDDEWARDFPGTPPERYAENADADGDGLPNWFEMLFFGQFPYMDTATAADPAADPDGDGFTNLDECRNDTDPLKPDVPYPDGYVWDAAEAARARFCFNPARDARRRNVWYALHGRARATGGAWLPAPVTGGAAKWRTFYDPNWQARIFFATNGVVELHARNDCPLAFAWRAPTAGTFEVSAAVRAGNGGGTLHAALQAGDQARTAALTAGKRTTLGPFKVNLKAGEDVLLSNDCAGAWGLNALFVDRFTVRRDAAE